MTLQEARKVIGLNIHNLNGSMQMAVATIMDAVEEMSEKIGHLAVSQEQPCEDLEKEVEWEWVHREKQEVDLIECAEMDKDEFVRFARHFYELGKQSKEPVSEDLEKKCATCAYFDAKTRRNGYCNAGAEKVVVATDTICELWKPYDMGNSEKKQILKGDRLTELDKLYKQAKRELEWFKEGKRQGKEEILKDAAMVEGNVLELGETYKDLTISVEGKELNKALQPLGAKEGDRVRMIITIKEDKK